MKTLYDTLMELYDMGELRNVKYPVLTEKYKGYDVTYTYSNKIKYLFITVSNGKVNCKLNLTSSEIENTEQQKVHVLDFCIKEIENFNK